MNKIIKAKKEYNINIDDYILYRMLFSWRDFTSGMSKDVSDKLDEFVHYLEDICEPNLSDDNHYWEIENESFNVKYDVFRKENW